MDEYRLRVLSLHHRKGTACRTRRHENAVGPKIPRTSYLVIAVGSGPDAWKRYVSVKWG